MSLSLSMRVRRAAAILAVLVAIPSTHAVQPITETFTGSLNGWVSGGSGSWTASNGVARLAFPTQSGPPVPIEGYLMASNASSGSFTGNYATAGLALIGFDFRAVDSVPDSLKITMNSTTSSYFRTLTASIVATGTWYSLTIPMTSRSAGSWSGTSDESAFNALLHDIRAISITVRESSVNTAPQVYQIDNVFIDILPYTSAFAPGDTNAAVAWDGLRTNVSYAIQGAASLTDAWYTISSLAPTGRAVSVTLPMTPTNQFMRLRLP